MKAVFVFDIPASMWLTENQRKDWRAKGRATGKLRFLGAVTAKALRAAVARGETFAVNADGDLIGRVEFPDGLERPAPWWSPERRCQYVAVIGWPSNRRSDSDNAMPTVKALLDGLVDGRILSDDGDAVIASRTLARDTANARKGFHRVTFCLEDVPERGELP